MDAAKEWPRILDFGTGATITEDLVESRYRKLAKKYHPDAGGSNEDMQQLNLAKQFALRWIANEKQRREIEKQNEARIAERLVELNRALRQQSAFSAQAYQQQVNEFSAWQQQWANQSLGGIGGLGQRMANAYRQESAPAEAPQPEAPVVNKPKSWREKLTDFLKR